MADTNDIPAVELVETNRRARGHNFYPSQVERKGVPALYSTEDVKLDDKIVYLHWFGPAQDWYAVEVDWAKGVAFGYVDLGLGGGEWGYFDLPEMEAIPRIQFVPIERDLYFTPTRAGSIDKIRTYRESDD